MSKRQQSMSPKATKAIDSAVRKIESKEKRQDDRTGKQGKPVDSIGRALRQGWTENA